MTDEELALLPKAVEIMAAAAAAPRPEPPLSPLQAAYLRRVLAHHAAEGRPPTIRELAGHFGVTGNAAHQQIKALARLGYVLAAGKCSWGVRLAGVVFEPRFVGPEGERARRALGEGLG